MPRDEPSFIVAPGECDELGAQFLDGFERPHPEQVLLAPAAQEAVGFQVWISAPDVSKEATPLGSRGRETEADVGGQTAVLEFIAATYKWPFLFCDPLGLPWKFGPRMKLNTG